VRYYWKPSRAALSLKEAKEVLAATATKRRAAREPTLDHDIAITVAAVAGERGWISRTAFDQAANLFQQLSAGAINSAEAKSRVKALMLRHGWIVRGEARYQFSPAQLKIMQEVITLAVFAIFALVVLQQPLRWNYFVSFALLIGAVVMIFV
jgi:hypothetical protein